MKKETNRNFFKITHFLILLLSLFLSVSCQKEDISETQEVNHKTITSQKISTSEVLNEINNPSIKKYISALSNTLEKSQNKNLNLALFTKIIKESQYTTYSLLINKYTTAKPYFFYFVIQKSTTIEKAGFAKYIPATAVTNLDVPHFTGILELYDIDDKLYARTSFVNGQAIPTPANTASKGQECGNVISIITHNCSHGGNHSPGQSCNNGYSNDGYYEVMIRVVCHTVNSITPPPDAYVGQSGGGSAGGGGLIPDVDEIFAFTESLTVEEQDWLAQNLASYNTIINYLVQKQWSEESKNFAQEIITQSRQTGLKLDIEKSVKSPFFIDLSSVSGNTPEELKFNEVYNILTTSPKFRELFTNMFGTNPLFNVKFKIDNIQQSTGSGHIDGNCKVYAYSNIPTPFNLITIDRSHLLTANKVSIALSIMHECIHAYLNIKLRNPSIGMTIENINNMDFVDCINTYYNSFSGNQTQHNFFANNMIPTMVNIFLEIKDLLLTPTQINNVVNNPNGNSSLYAVTQTTPSVVTSNIISWNWIDYFTHVSFTGLQNCTAYSTYYPVGSPNALLSEQYLYLAAFNFYN